MSNAQVIDQEQAEQTEQSKGEVAGHDVTANYQHILAGELFKFTTDAPKVSAFVLLTLCEDGSQQVSMAGSNHETILGLHTFGMAQELLQISKSLDVDDDAILASFVDFVKKAKADLLEQKESVEPVEAQA